MDARRLSPEVLNERRRRAVKLRLSGMTISEVAHHVELSAPTVIAAHKAYRHGGWPAVATRKRGRLTGAGRKVDSALEGRLLSAMARCAPDHLGLSHPLWSDRAVAEWFTAVVGVAPPRRSLARYREGWGIRIPDPLLGLSPVQRLDVRAWLRGALNPTILRHGHAYETFWTGVSTWVASEGLHSPSYCLLYARGRRGRFYWLIRPSPPASNDFIEFWTRLRQLSAGVPIVISSGALLDRAPDLVEWLAKQTPPWPLVQRTAVGGEATHPTLGRVAPESASHSRRQVPVTVTTFTARSRESRSVEATMRPRVIPNPDVLTHLQRLEAESIHVMREVVAEADNPVMLYSIGKDSAVMLHLATKAFHPARPPFPLLHVDTTWKFKAMYEFRDAMARTLGMDLLVHVNREGLIKGINPFTHGSAIHTDVMKTEALKQALDGHGFDAAFGGARRDEEKSRAKERIFSFRTTKHHWDPKNQRPELWNLYNTRKHRGESIRVFPLSNWTELDIWQYIYLQNIPIVPLYYAADRPVVERDGTLIMVDDDRLPLRPGEVPMVKRVRFRTLGCYPLTGAIESEADTLIAIIQEMLLARTSERQGRIIDHDSKGSMEKKKQEGYF